ncbi:MAG: hypothetical protein M3423_10675, partial [Actinomycetota bacterium]|nr:hypothetical protein [Actinomycetota bacterium]
LEDLNQVSHVRHLEVRSRSRRRGSCKHSTQELAGSPSGHGRIFSLVVPRSGEGSSRAPH